MSRIEQLRLLRKHFSALDPAAPSLKAPPMSRSASGASGSNSSTPDWKGLLFAFLIVDAVVFALLSIAEVIK